MKKRWISVIIGCAIIALIAIAGNVCRVRTVEVRFDGPQTDVTAEEIFSASGIDMRRSILGINENTVKENVNKAFADHSVYVRNIERKFPNKVILYVEERIPICAVKLSDPARFGYEDGDGYGITDMDFQMDAVGSRAEAEESELIYLEGVTVSDTYNTSAFEYVHKIFSAFESLGFDADAQKKLIAVITVGSNTATVKFRDGYVMELDATQEELAQKVQTEYGAYLTTLEG